MSQVPNQNALILDDPNKAQTQALTTLLRRAASGSGLLPQPTPQSTRIPPPPNFIRTDPGSVPQARAAQAPARRVGAPAPQQAATPIPQHTGELTGRLGPMLDQLTPPSQSDPASILGEMRDNAGLGGNIQGIIQDGLAAGSRRPATAPQRRVGAPAPAQAQGQGQADVLGQMGEAAGVPRLSDAERQQAEGFVRRVPGPTPVIHGRGGSVGDDAPNFMQRELANSPAAARIAAAAADAKRNGQPPRGDVLSQMGDAAGVPRLSDSERAQAEEIAGPTLRNRALANRESNGELNQRGATTTDHHRPGAGMGEALVQGEESIRRAAIENGTAIPAEPVDETVSPSELDVVQEPLREEPGTAAQDPSRTMENTTLRAAEIATEMAKGARARRDADSKRRGVASRESRLSRFTGGEERSKFDENVVLRDGVAPRAGDEERLRQIESGNFSAAQGASPGLTRFLQSAEGRQALQRGRDSREQALRDEHAVPPERLAEAQALLEEQSNISPEERQARTERVAARKEAANQRSIETTGQSINERKQERREKRQASRDRVRSRIQERNDATRESIAQTKSDRAERQSIKKTASQLGITSQEAAALHLQREAIRGTDEDKDIARRRAAAETGAIEAGTEAQRSQTDIAERTTEQAEKVFGDAMDTADRTKAEGGEFPPLRVTDLETGKLGGTLMQSILTIRSKARSGTLTPSHTREIESQFTSMIDHIDTLPKSEQKRAAAEVLAIFREQVPSGLFKDALSTVFRGAFKSRLTMVRKLKEFSDLRKRLEDELSSRV